MGSTAKQTAQAFFESQDHRKGGPAPELCADGYTARIASFPPMDLEGHDAFASRFYAAFPDLRHVLSDVIAERDRVAARLSIVGTNDGEFMGMPPTNRQVMIPALVLLTIKSGRVLSLDGQFDQSGCQLSWRPTPRTNRYCHTTACYRKAPRATARR